jgi:hypothetical protein
MSNGPCHLMLAGMRARFMQLAFVTPTRLLPAGSGATFCAARRRHHCEHTGSLVCAASRQVAGTALSMSVKAHA